MKERIELHEKELELVNGGGLFDWVGNALVSIGEFACCLLELEEEEEEYDQTAKLNGRFLGEYTTR